MTFNAANKIGGDLTAAERRGFAVFSNPNKGNCFACSLQRRRF